VPQCRNLAGALHITTRFCRVGGVDNEGVRISGFVVDVGALCVEYGDCSGGSKWVN
jgi:hypothetical protein